jgi:hypothetical protein
VLPFMFTSLPTVPKVEGTMGNGDTNFCVFNTWKNVIDDVSYEKAMLTNIVHEFKLLHIFLVALTIECRGGYLLNFSS